MELRIINHCMIVFTSENIIKIQLFGDNLDRDLRGRELFYSKDKSLVSPMEVQKKIPLSISMPILEKPQNYDEAADYILKEMKKFGNIISFKICDYPLLEAGLDILEKGENGKKAKEKVYTFLHRREYSPVRVGLVHGDFHRGNIMYMNGKPILIDFDCARENDIQAVDALYYILEEKSISHNKKWLEYWISIYIDSSNVNTHICFQHADVEIKFGLIILLLERIAQDIQDTPDKYAYLHAHRKTISKINSLLITDIQNC